MNDHARLADRRTLDFPARTANRREIERSIERCDRLETRAEGISERPGEPRSAVAIASEKKPAGPEDRARPASLFVNQPIDDRRII
jgi:hypothetical protein